MELNEIFTSEICYTIKYTNPPQIHQEWMEQLIDCIEMHGCFLGGGAGDFGVFAKQKSIPTVVIDFINKHIIENILEIKSYKIDINYYDANGKKINKFETI